MNLRTIIPFGGESCLFYIDITGLVVLVLVKIPLTVRVLWKKVFILFSTSFYFIYFKFDPNFSNIFDVSFGIQAELRKSLKEAIEQGKKAKPADNTAALEAAIKAGSVTAKALEEEKGMHGANN